MLNPDGIIVGAATFAIIAFSRYACIKAEYFFTKSFWIVFLMIGVVSIVAALLLASVLLSAIFAVFGFAFLWGIGEIIEQEERVRKGWFPKNPKHQKI